MYSKNGIIEMLSYSQYNVDDDVEQLKTIIVPAMKKRGFYFIDSSFIINIDYENNTDYANNNLFLTLADRFRQQIKSDIRNNKLNICEIPGSQPSSQSPKVVVNGFARPCPQDGQFPRHLQSQSHHIARK